MNDTKTILLMERLAFRSGSRYYPFRIIKKVHGSGEMTYSVEMRIGKNDVIVSDAPTLEEVLKKHEELLGYAFVTRDLQGWKSKSDPSGEKGDEGHDRQG